MKTTTATASNTVTTARAKALGYKRAPKGFACMDGVTISLDGITMPASEVREIIRVVAQGARAGATAHEIVRAVDAQVGHVVGIEDAAVVSQRAKVWIGVNEFGRSPERARGCCASDRFTAAKCRCGEE